MAVPCCKEANHVSILKMVAAFFLFQSTSIDCLPIVESYTDIRSVFLKIGRGGGGQVDPLKKLISKSPAILQLKTILLHLFGY